MKHLTALTKPHTSPAPAASSLFVKEAYIAVWTDTIGLLSDTLGFIEDLIAFLTPDEGEGG